MNRTTIIQYFIDKYKYESYLEIGVRKGANFNKIKCNRKVGVDPDATSAATLFMTSDTFFQKLKEDDLFDLIFIDGLHHFEQVTTDLNNANMHLSRNGTIILHDCLPVSEKMQQVPRTQKAWTGDTWKAFVLCRTVHGFEMNVVNCDYGVGIIRKSTTSAILNIEKEQLNYQQFKKNKKEWLNLLTEREFYQKY